jgi:hypothetical protein
LTTGCFGRPLSQAGGIAMARRLKGESGRIVVVTLVELLLIAIVGLVGCGRSAAKPEPSPRNLQQIQVLYTIYLQSNKLTGPANEDEFKRFVRSQGAAEARRQEIDLGDLDQLFISPRDGQPYVVNYGLHFEPQKANQQVVVYETRGRDGLRAVAFATGWSEEVDAKRAAELGLKEL